MKQTIKKDEFMNTLRKVLRKIVLLPNYPFMAVFALYLVVQIIRHNRLSDLLTTDPKSYDTPEMRSYVDKRYPESLMRVVAAVFYGCLASWLIFN